MCYVHCSTNTCLLNRSLFAVARSRRGLTVNAGRWSEPLGGWSGSTGLHTLQLTTALGVRSWTVSAHCSRYAEYWKSAISESRHDTRALWSRVNSLLSAPADSNTSASTHTVHEFVTFLGVKSLTSGPLHWLLHLMIFRCDLQTASVIFLRLAVLKWPKSLRVCHQNPAPLIRCPHGWSRRHKTFWFLSFVICVMRPYVAPFLQSVRSKPSYFLGWRKVIWTLIIWHPIDQSQISPSPLK